MHQKTILVLAANPKHTPRLRLDVEVRELKFILKQIDLQNRFKVEDAGAVRSTDIQALLLAYKPFIVHITGHGSGKEGIQFEDHVVYGEALADLFKIFNEVHCVVLNSCTSAYIARQIANHVDYVVGMSQEISDEAAIRFTVGFYMALAAAKSIEFAYRLGCNAIRLANIAEYSVPILFRKDKFVFSDCVVNVGNILVTIRIDQDFDTYSLEDVKALIKVICNRLQIDENLVVQSMKRGSVELTIELPANQATPLLNLVNSGALHTYHLLSAEVVQRADLADLDFEEIVAAEFPNLLEVSNNIYASLSAQRAIKVQKVETAPATDFARLFRDNIIRSAQHVFERLETLGEAFLPQAERELALHILDYALKYADAWPQTSQILLALAPKMEQEGHRDEWIPYLEQGIQQSRLQQDGRTEAGLHLQLGILYQLRAKFETASEEFRLSAIGFEQMGDLQNQAKAQNRRAYVARLLRNYEEANQFADEALERLDDADPELAYNYFVRGTIAYDQPNWREAAAFFQKALAIWEQGNNQRMVAWSLTNLGVAMRAQQRYAEAIQYYERAIALLEEVHDPVYQAVTRMNLGNVYLSRNQPQQALDLYTRAESVFRKAMDELHLAMIYTNIGIAHRYLKNWSWAKLALLESIEGWQQLGNIESLVNATEELGILYLDQGMYAQATTKFHDALNWLSQIRDEPGYAPLLESITTHLQQAQSRMEGRLFTAKASVAVKNIVMSVNPGFYDDVLIPIGL